jgi:hypothetical protein
LEIVGTRMVLFLAPSHSTLLRAVLHNEELYGPNTDLFIPERWLTPDGQINTAMREPSVAFGYGRRVCPVSSISGYRCVLGIADPSSVGQRHGAVVSVDLRRLDPLRVGHLEECGQGWSSDRAIGGIYFCYALVCGVFSEFHWRQLLQLSGSA